MKTHYRAMSLILIVSLLIITNALFTPAQKGQAKKVRVKSKVEKGRNVGDHVRQLRETDKRVRGALEAFEKRGHSLKLDEATSITGTVTPENEEVAFRKASYNHHQQTTVTGDGIELIFVTALDLFNEWQGLGIAHFYDATGALTDSYVADVVITRSEYNPTEWTARYELKFESDGLGYLNHQPGMFTNFNLGTPIQQQAAPLYLLPEQFPDPAVRDWYYQTYPQQLIYDSLAPGATPRDGGGDGIILIMPARFQSYEPFLRNPRPVQRNLVGYRPFAAEAGRNCAGLAGGCFGASLFFAELSFAPCATAGCIGAVLVSAANNLRPRRP
ncbi:MAG TPA: hypothetical protein VGJ55_01785 [Pyrinomonadaceae bacterium]|jgi:hypothetical protein